MAINKLNWRWLVTMLLGIAFASIAITNRSHKTPLREHEYDAEEHPEISAIRKQLLGTWHLESYELKLHAPIIITRYPLGPKATGLLTYSPDGYMSAQLMQPGSTKFNKAAYQLGSDKEMAEAARHYLAYAGTYSIGLTSDLVPYINHTVEASLFPNWIGTNQTRLVGLKNGRLTMLPDEPYTWMGIQVEPILRWRKQRRGSSSFI